MNNPVTEFFRNKYLDVRFRKLVDDSASIDFSVALGAVEKVLVLLSGDPDGNEALTGFLKQLSRLFDGGHVATFSMDTLRKDDMTWLGIPQQRYLDSIRSEQYDLVIDTVDPPTHISSYISALSGAPLRLNLYDNPWAHVYNLHFRTDNSRKLDEQLSNILRYLKTLKKTEK